MLSSPTSTALAASSPSPKPCDCSCLCPMAAFPMAAYQMAPNAARTIATSSTQTSTLQTVVAAGVGNLTLFSTASKPVSSNNADTTPSTSSPSTSQMESLSTSGSGVLPSVIVTDQATATVKAQQKNAQDAQDAPLDINNYSLMKSVSLPVIVGRAVEPTAAV